MISLMATVLSLTSVIVADPEVVPQGPWTVARDQLRCVAQRSFRREGRLISVQLSRKLLDDSVLVAASVTGLKLNVPVALTGPAILTLDQAGSFAPTAVTYGDRTDGSGATMFFGCRRL